MRDEDFSYFIKKFGEATSSVTVPVESIEKWRGVLPDVLLTYWESEGWGTYRSGLFSLVDPDEYEDVLDMWLEGTQFEEMDSYHVIAKNAFGYLYAFGETTGRNITVMPIFNQIIYNKSECVKKTLDDLNIDIQSFLAFSNPKGFDMVDSNDDSLFDKAVSKYGPLAKNEIFGFEPAYVLGGSMEFEDLRKLDCQVHIMILRELSSPEIISH